LKKLDLGQTIGIFANIGVVAGIVLLALELRQNNLLMQSQARMNRLELRQSSNNELFNSPHLFSAHVRWTQGEDLSVGDRDLIRRYWTNRYLNFNSIYEEYQNGLIPEYQLQSEGFRGMINGPAFEYWSGIREQLNPEFVLWAEDHLENQ